MQRGERPRAVQSASRPGSPRDAIPMRRQCSTRDFDGERLSFRRDFAMSLRSAVMVGDLGRPPGSGLGSPSARPTPQPALLSVSAFSRPAMLANWIGPSPSHGRAGSTANRKCSTEAATRSSVRDPDGPFRSTRYRQDSAEPGHVPGSGRGQREPGFRGLTPIANTASPRRISSRPMVRSTLGVSTRANGSGPET